MRIGAHTPISGGYKKSVEYIIGAGGNTMQIFSGNPRGWSRTPIPPKKAREFIQLRKKHEIYPLFIHAPYLINIAGEGEIYEKSVRALTEEFKRADILNADYLVLHPGSSKKKEEGITRIAGAVKSAVEKVTPKAKLLIENTAGGGNRLGSSPEELLHIREAIQFETGFCIDTAHAFQAGFKMKDMAPLAPYTELVHVNDSKTPLGSRSDRHAGIGEGVMGVELFSQTLKSPLWRKKVFIIETPGGRELDRKNINLLKSLR